MNMSVSQSPSAAGCARERSTRNPVTIGTALASGGALHGAVDRSRLPGVAR